MSKKEFYKQNAHFMRLAIKLAKKGEGRTNPNPLVGAIIVKKGVVIGKGFHHKYGSLHAEREALNDCIKNGHDPKGAELFVTLEPCCHIGKQPPCTDAIINAKIKKVFVGSRDPNPLVSGKGNKKLLEHGIQVEEDFLRSECDSLNKIFFHYITTRTPYVALKFAMTLDGKIATHTLSSKWISCKKSRKISHKLRNKYSCILAGINTVLNDNPLLNCRIKGGRNPVRIILDSHLRIPLDSKIIKTAHEIQTIIFYAECAEGTSNNCNSSSFSNTSPKNKMCALKDAGAEIICCGKNKVDIKTVMNILAERGLDSVLIEGGSQINFSALGAGIVNHIYCYVAPKIFGGSTSPTAVSGLGVENVEDSFNFKLTSIKKIKGDVLLEYDSVVNDFVTTPNQKS